MTARDKSSKARKRAAPARRPRPAAVVLAAECTTAQTGELHSRLTAVFAKDSAAIDISAVKHIDAASLQLLAAFVRDRRAAGRTVQWLGAADAFKQSACCLGLQMLLA